MQNTPPTATDQANSRDGWGSNLYSAVYHVSTKIAMQKRTEGVSQRAALTPRTPFDKCPLNANIGLLDEQTSVATVCTLTPHELSFAAIAHHAQTILTLSWPGTVVCCMWAKRRSLFMVHVAWSPSLGGPQLALFLGPFDRAATHPSPALLDRDTRNGSRLVNSYTQYSTR